MADIQKLIAQVTAAGGRLWLEKGQVRYSAPPGALAPDALAALRRHKDAIAALLALQAGPQPMGDFSPVGRSQMLPLSCEELFFFDPVRNNRTGFPVSRTCLRLGGPWQAEILIRALGLLVQRNEILRTGFIEENGQGRRVIAAPDCFAVTRIDAKDLDDAAILNTLVAAALKDGDLYDLSHPPLFRATLLQGDDELFLLMTAHHITYDGGTLAVLMNKLLTLYLGLAGGEPAPAPPLLQYADYAFAQAAWLRSGAARPLADYWRARCAGLPPPPDLKFESGDVPVKRLAATIDIPAEIVSGIAAVGESVGASLFMVVQTLLNILLAARSGQSDIVTGSPFMTRDQHESKEMLGCLVNQLMFRNRIDLEKSFLELMAGVRAETLAAYDNQPLPSDLMADDLGMPFEDFHHRAYSVMLVSQWSLPALDDSLLAGTGLTMAMHEPFAIAAAVDERMPPPPPGLPVLSMILTGLERGKPLQGILTCFRGTAPGIQASLKAMVAQMRHLMVAAGAAPGAPVASLLARGP